MQAHRGSLFARPRVDGKDGVAGRLSPPLPAERLKAYHHIAQHIAGFYRLMGRDDIIQRKRLPDLVP